METRDALSHLLGPEQERNEGGCEERARAFSRERQCSSSKVLQPKKTHKIQVTESGVLCSGFEQGAVHLQRRELEGTGATFRDAQVPHRAHKSLREEHEPPER